MTASARRALTDRLPPTAAFAAFEFIVGPLLDNPHRVGKPLFGKWAGSFGARRGDYRVIFDIDEDKHTVVVLDVDHRRDIYRRR